MIFHKFYHSLDKEVLKVVRSHSKDGQGDSYGGPIYGEFTPLSYNNIFQILVEHFQFNNESIFVDLGSGLGIPNLLAAKIAKSSFGIEVQPNRFVVRSYI